MLRYWGLKETGTSYEKYFAKGRKIMQNWTRPENFDMCFCVRFDQNCQKLIFGGEIRH